MVLMYSRIRLLSLLSVSRKASNSSTEHAEQMSMMRSSERSPKQTRPVTLTGEVFRQRLRENMDKEKEDKPKSSKHNELRVNALSLRSHAIRIRVIEVGDCLRHGYCS